MKVKKIDDLFDIVFSMLLLSLSISIAIPNIILGILLVVFLLKEGKVIHSNWYIKLVLLFVGYFTLKASYNNSFIEDFVIYKHYILILLLTILTFNLKNKLLAINGYVIGVVLAVLISFFKIVSFYISNKQLPFGNTADVQELIVIHRPYFGFMCLLAIILIDYLIIKIKKKYLKVFYSISFFIVFIFLYIIVARLSLFLASIYIFIKFINYFKFLKAKYIVGLLIVLSLVLCAVFSVNKNLKKRLHIKNSYSETLKVLKNQEPRFVIWACAYKQIINEDFNLLLGNKSLKSTQKKMNKCYDVSIENESKRDYFVLTEFNTHNQFFDIFLNGGFVGLLLLLTIFAVVAYEFRLNFNAFFLIMSFFFFLSLENLFVRQWGAYLFGIFVPLFYKITKEKTWK